MKCAYHSGRDAIAKCSLCNKPLCKECAVTDSKKAAICSSCVAMASAQEALQEIGERREFREERQEARKAKKKKPTYLMIVLPLSLFAALVMLGFNFYLRATIPEMAESPEPEHPVVAILLLDQAIQDYLEDHNGNVPRSLSELLGKYIATDELSQADLQNYSYRVISPTSYELSSKSADDETAADLIFTEGGAE